MISGDGLEGGEVYFQDGKGREKLIDLKPGESIKYGKRQRHGVRKVRAGERIVFVTWFNSKRSKVS